MAFYDKWIQKAAYKAYRRQMETAGGDMKQVQAPGSFMELLTPDKPKWTNWTTAAAVNEGYKASIYVYAAINKKAKAAASVPWHVYRENPDGTYEKLERHPLQMLLDRPNPFTSRNSMIERLIMQLDLAGNSIFHLITVGGRAVELWNIPPDQIEPVADRQEFISEYEFRGIKGQPPQRIPAGEILHAMYIDPGNPYWGISPLQVAARTVDTEVEAVNWNKVSLQNRAVTDGVFSVKEPLTESQYNELRQQVREQHQGAKNARAPWILGAGAEWQQMSLSPADMDFIEGRKLTREEICSIFQVPPPLVGILEKANYNNMQETRRVFWLDTIIPLLDDLKETFNRALLPYFEPGIVLDYDTSAVDALTENVNEKIEAANKLFSMGVPFNIINKNLDLGFDEIEGGNTGYLPASLLPAEMAGDPAARAAAPAAAAGQETAGDEPKKRPARYSRKGLLIQSDEQKTLYWKAIEKQRARWDLLLQKDAIDIFDKERAAIVNRFKRNGGDIEDALQGIDPERWRKYLIKHYRAIIKQFGQATYDSFKSYFPDMETKDFDPYDEIILAYIEEAAAEKVVQITTTTMMLTRRSIYQAREEERTTDELARALDQSFEDYSTHRAYRIARTEVAASSNFGSYAGAEMASRETGDLVKEWVDSRDSRVRRSHSHGIGVGGEKVRFYSRFSNGLLFPGDMRNGSAKDVIHCRCVIAYHPIAYVDPGEITR